MKEKNKIDGFDKLATMSGEEIVISGLSGVFPNSDSVLEFGENLFNKVDMVCDEPRWKSNNSEIPKHVGKISDIDKFDAQFFRVGYKNAQVLEPISRKILEHAYGAIFDSGNTQSTLQGVKIGVFVGTSFTDFSILCMQDTSIVSDFLVSGSSKSMQANRISYWVDGRGPSYSLDFCCASSSAVLEIAYSSIKNNECDAAIVGSGNICSHAILSLNLKNAGLLTCDGKTKCFDKDADGYVRAEAVSLLFLQKAKDAKRIYAQLYHAKGNFEMEPDAQFLPIRKSDQIQKFLTEFYSETDIEPEDVEYVEANGAAIANADENELDAIGKVFARDKLVKIGCVKSNMGHSEAASGLTAVTKLCLAYHRGELPANLHFAKPVDVPAMKDGKLQVLTDTTKFTRNFTAINNFSFSGANYHILLKGLFKEKNLAKYKLDIPRIVLASGRQETSMTKIFDWLKSKPIDEEEIALLHSIFEKDIIGHTGRGYTILDSNTQNEPVSLSESAEYYSGVRRPLWFVFSGMGSQWTRMGEDLMRIPTFMKAIERCHKVLEPRGVDIIKIISGPDKTIFDNILNAFVGIGAVQIGLTDILKEMGVEPDYIIGHSLGEMACAYHDGTLSAEETILATYSRGKAILETSLVNGAMAAVGVGHKKLVKYCPSTIDIACHNSSESSTISGPVEDMREFVAELTSRGIFAREVPSANVAYHSRYIADAGPALLQRLRDVIDRPKLRSKKWISTSVPKEHWDEHNAKYSSPEYHTNNMLSPVLFEEMTSMIPENAVVVEVAPHGLLQAILKRSHPKCTHIPLTRRGCMDGVKLFLDGIGKLYEAGYNPKVDILYPKVEFPVSTETPILSHLIEWEHSETWFLTKNNIDEETKSSVRDFTISSLDDDYSYIADNVKNGVTTIPEAALLFYVWETLAINNKIDFRHLSVIFSDIYFHKEIIVKPETNVKLSILINKGTDRFEITQDDSLVASGIISGVKNVNLKNIEDCSNDNFDDVCINSKDIYRIFKIRGYGFKAKLKSLYSVNVNVNSAQIKWTNEWVPFLDSLIQLNIFLLNNNSVTKPKFIRRLKISVLEQAICQQDSINEMSCFNAKVDAIVGTTRCAGVEINDITFVNQQHVNKKPNIIVDKSFFPFFATEKVNIYAALEVVVQVISENAHSKYINIIKPIEPSECDIFKNLRNIVNTFADTMGKVIQFNSMRYDESNFDLDPSHTNVLVCDNTFFSSKMTINIQSLTTVQDFILCIDNQVPNEGTEFRKHFNVLVNISDGKHILTLLKKRANKIAHFFPITSTLETKFLWISQIYNEIATTKKVVLVSENQSYSGVNGFVEQLRREGHQNIALMAIDDIHAQKFDPNNEFFKKQLERNMAINTLKKGQWGGYYYTSCAKSVSLRNFTLKNTVPGEIDTLSWVEASPSLDKKHLVQVSFAGLSLNDCQKATNISTDANASFGMDFSGINNNGDRVMGLVSGGAVFSSIEADPDLIWPVPDHWSLEDAASVPLPYVYAYYCLVLRIKLLKRQTVLITNGAEALGQAVIALCLAIDCTIFTTVNTLKEKEFLLRRFPQLNDFNICNTANESVHSVVMENTQNQGCQVVVSNSTKDLREAAMKCLDVWGIFLDLSNYEMIENKYFGMSFLCNDKTYIGVDLSNIFKREYAQDKKVLQKCLCEGIAKGFVTPLNRLVYTPTMVSRAFRLLSMRRNIGRVLLRLRDPTIMKQGLEVTPRLTFNSEDVVLVVCDENDLGVALADKLIERGVQKIMLHIKSNAISGHTQMMFKSWSKREVSVQLSSENLRTQHGCALLIKNAMKFGKVKAVFIVLDVNEINGDKDVQKGFSSAYSNTCSVVLNLDLASRNCRDLSNFTIVTRLPQNASDEYALSVVERVAELRNEMGFPALVIRYNSLAELNEPLSLSKKLKPQTFSTFFNSIEISLKMKYKNVLTCDLREENLDFRKKIVNILGVRDIEDLKNETTLQELDLNEIPLKELRAVIKNSYQIDNPLETISSMTIKSLKEFGNNENVQTLNFECGMAAFYKQLITEENYLLQHPVETMSTREMSIVNKNNATLIMIPGFEGYCEIFKTEAEKLKMKAIGLNLGPDMKGDTIQEIAADLRKEIKSKFDIKSKFYLLGYSFGVNVALELAAILENEGITGVIYCLDSSPDALKLYLDAYMGKLPEDKFQNAVLNHMYRLMTGHGNKELENELDFPNKLEDKIKVTLKYLKRNISYSEQYERNVLETAFERINLAKEYKPTMKLKSELVLLKGIPHPNAEIVTDDYNLSLYSEKPIKMFHLNSEHGIAFQDVRVSNIINGHILNLKD